MDISTDHSTGTKFGDLKKEERFKRLERDLRLEFIKHMERIKADINKCTSPTWPSVSSINPDNLDTSCANGPSLQVSRVESEVISSSSNLQKVFPMPKFCERPPMATSSVKHFPVKDYDKDRAIMPPPSSNFPFAGQRRFSTHDIKQNEQIKSHDSSMKMSSATSCSSYQEDDPNTSQNLEHSRSFTRWRVLLNDQGQLIIKGTLDCGKIARSKPVIHRLSSTTVQSIYKHIYILMGPLVDDKEELPDYVRGKFHNGFPDDWENVHQLWTSYVSEGCKETFRWPTPITDSDDDLYSEITDFSYIRSKQIEYREQLPNIVVNNGSSLGYHSRAQSDSNLNFEKFKEDKFNSSNQNKLQVDNKSIEDSGHSSGIRDSNMYANEHGNKNISQDSQNTSGHFSNSNLKNASFLSQIIKEEKLRIIMSNLGDKNCPPQYLDKLIELSDCLRYILSYTPDDCATDCNKQDLSGSKSQNQTCEKCNHSTISLVESSQEDNSMKLKNKTDGAKTDCVNKSLSKPNVQSEYTPVTKYAKQKDSDSGDTQDSSDSDCCMGVPHIPADRLILPKSPRLQRYRDKRYRNRERSDAKKNDQMETLMVPVLNSKATAYDDSSVSVTEDEFQRRKHEMRDHQFKEPFSKIKSNESIKTRRVPSFNTKDNENINTVNHKSDLYSGSNRTPENLTEKHKPIIKSCEPANYKLISLQQVKNQTVTPPDVSILSDDGSIKTKDHLNPKNNSQNENINKNQEKLQKDAVKHPFLSYDSEDYFNEREANMQIELPPSLTSNKTKDKKANSFEKKEYHDDNSAKQEPPKKVQTEQTTSLEAKKSAASSNSNSTEIFGSKINPKILTSWTPCVEYDKTNDKLSLKFEGKLLNECGHTLHRKFRTDSISKRHSSKLIETEKNEYFKLSGDLNVTKHVVPKELLKQCTTGCPTKIKEFCENWKKLLSVFKKLYRVLEKGESVKPDNTLDASIDVYNIPTSKRGRPIVPTLSYWHGERLVKKDTFVVYDPGNKKENVLTPTAETAKKEPLSEQRQRGKSNKDANVKGSVSAKTSKAKENPSDTEKRRSPLKKRLVQQLTYSSKESSDSDEEPKKFRKLSGGTRPSPAMKLEKVQPKPKRQIARPKNQADPEDARKMVKANVRQSRTRSSRPECEWSYEKDQSYPDLLSDDQVSVIK